MRTAWSAGTRVDSSDSIATAAAADAKIVAAGIQVVVMAEDGGRDAGSHCKKVISMKPLMHDVGDTYDDIQTLLAG